MDVFRIQNMVWDITTTVFIAVRLFRSNRTAFFEDYRQILSPMQSDDGVGPSFRNVSDQLPKSGT
jgi:hypothetical protein